MKITSSFWPQEKQKRFIFTIEFVTEKINDPYKQYVYAH